MDLVFAEELHRPRTVSSSLNLDRSGMIHVYLALVSVPVEHFAEHYCEKTTHAFYVLEESAVEPCPSRGSHDLRLFPAAYEAVNPLEPKHASSSSSSLGSTGTTSVSVTPHILDINLDRPAQDTDFPEGNTSVTCLRVPSPDLRL